MYGPFLRGQAYANVKTRSRLKRDSLILAVCIFVLERHGTFEFEIERLQVNRYIYYCRQRQECSHMCSSGCSGFFQHCMARVGNGCNHPATLLTELLLRAQLFTNF